jgi:hypothetical protein
LPESVRSEQCLNPDWLRAEISSFDWAIEEAPEASKPQIMTETVIIDIFRADLFFIRDLLQV